ncbi:MAG TPA: hypothetical protein VEJ20_09030 [Candidatus Eremiobacteraceae bacterium]|nr:hypothetical protein [Candidatus Eremiobacteraceae bacterium]
MAKTPPSRAEEEHRRTVTRLSTLFAATVVLSALAFLAPSIAYQHFAQWVLGAIAGPTDEPPVAAPYVAALIGLVVDCFLALLVGYFGARYLARAIVRIVPKNKRPPLEPVPYAAACAAAVIVAFSFLMAATTQPIGALGFAVLLVRDALVAALIWFAARRALAPRKA